MISDINKEIIRVLKMTDLKIIDDLSELSSKSVFLGNIYRLKDRGTKCYKKNSFFTSLFIYTGEGQKGLAYEYSENLLDLLDNNFFKNEEDYTVNYEIRKEEIKKVNSDVGKFYQYEIQIQVKVY